jgi:hypothetical protein
MPAPAAGTEELAEDAPAAEGGLDAASADIAPVSAPAMAALLPAVAGGADPAALAPAGGSTTLTVFVIGG